MAKTLLRALSFEDHKIEQLVEHIEKVEAQAAPGFALVATDLASPFGWDQRIRAIQTTGFGAALGLCN